MDKILYHAIQNMQRIAGLTAPRLMLPALCLADIPNPDGISAITSGTPLPVCGEGQPGAAMSAEHVPSQEGLALDVHRYMADTLVAF